MSGEADSLGPSYAAALQPAAAGPEPSVPPPAERILEALLFAGGTPLTAERAGGVVRGVTPEIFTALIEQLNSGYRRQNRPYTIQAQDHGYILVLRPRFQGLRDKLQGGPREARLSRAAVEVLSLIAFQQPIAKSRIDSQRGCDSSGAVRQLVRLGLVAAQTEAGRGVETTYLTTGRFLEFFGLQSLDDLPQTLDLQQI